jgi:hypothetical protein
MANSAFESGFNSALDRKQKNKTDDDKSSKPDTGRKRRGGGGGGGMSFSILPIIGKALGMSTGSRKHGGRIRKTGVYLMHKGENVIPAKHGHAKKRITK